MTERYQIHGCRIMETVDRVQVMERVSDDEAQTFAIYETDDDGCVTWVSDHSTKELAEEHVKALCEGVKQC